MGKFNWEKIKIEENQSKKQTTGPVGIMSEEQCMKVVEKVAKELGFNELEEAMMVISGICQRGGTNKNISGILSYQWGNATLTVQKFHSICQSEGGTPRQFARGMAQEIYEAAKLLKEEGDLARQMRAEVTNITEDEAIWCSNFQGTNPSCPETVRRWLFYDQRRRFGGR